MRNLFALGAELRGYARSPSSGSSGCCVGPAMGGVGVAVGVVVKRV